MNNGFIKRQFIGVLKRGVTRFPFRGQRGDQEKNNCYHLVSAGANQYKFLMLCSVVSISKNNNFFNTSPLPTVTVFGLGKEKICLYNV